MPLPQLLLQVAVRGALILLATSLAALLFRRSSAATRHLIWSGGLTASLVVALLPTLGSSLAVLPALPAPTAAIRIDSPAEASRESPAAPPRSVQSASGPGDQWSGFLSSSPSETPQGGTNPTTVATEPRNAPVHWTRLLVLAWLGGIGVLLLRLLAGQVGIARLARTAVPVSSPEWNATLREPGILSGLRPVRFLESADVPTPCTWGILHPAVLLPAEGAEWPAEARRQVVIHELAHVRRRDTLTHLIGSLAVALHWFNPLGWLASRAARVAREQACDDAVLAAGGVPSSYASLLLAAAAPERGGPWMPVEALAMARRSQIGARLLALLDPARRRDPADRRAVSWVAVAALSVGLPVASVGPRVIRAAEPVAPDSSASPSTQTPATLPPAAPAIPTAVSERASTRRPAPEADPRQAQSCLTAKGGKLTVHLSSSIAITGEGTAEDGKGNMLAAWTGPNCTIAIRVKGKVTFNESETDVASVSSNGRFEIEHDEDNHSRSYLVTNRSGSLERRYRRNDNDAPMDQPAVEWRNSMIQEFIRRTGYNAEARVDRIWKSGGMDAVVREIGMLTSDGVRTRYIRAVFQNPAVTAADITRLLTLAKAIESDGDRAGVLAAVPERFLADRAVQHAWGDAAEGIESDGDLSTVLVQVLRSGKLASDACEWVVNLAGNIDSDGDRSTVLIAATDALQWSPGCARRALELTRGIDSDGDKSEVLVQFLGRHGLPAELITTFFQASGSISSDGDHSEVLHHVIRLDRPSDKIVAALLDDSRGISSDGDRSAVLVDAARKGLIRTDALKQAYLTSAREISSDGDRREALRVVRAKD